MTRESGESGNPSGRKRFASASSLGPLFGCLRWLGRQGARAVAGVILLAVALPPLGEALRPYVAGAVIALLTIAFLRLDPGALLGHLRRPCLAILAIAWTSVAIPGLIGAAASLLGLNRAAPDLFTGIVLQAASSPMMAAPALAAILGLDATLVLISLVASTALVPLTAPIFAHLFLGDAFTIQPTALGGRLFVILAASIVGGLLLRRAVGPARIARYRLEIDGINIIGLFVFAAALMGDVAAGLLASPLLWMALLATGVAVFAVFFGLSVLVFQGAGREAALAVGFMTAQRNVGLMLAAAGGLLSDLTWLYFALSQLPVYFSPALMQPLLARLRRASRGA